MVRNLRVFIVAISIFLLLLGKPANLAAIEFAAAKSYPVGTNPQAIAVGDFNGDGKPDLAVANFGSNNVSVLINNGDGTFKAAVNYAVGSSPQALAVGDFNGDGKLDLIVTNLGDPSNHVNGNLSLLKGNGDGTFQAAVSITAGLNPNTIAVADLNGDHKLDLIVGDASNSDLSILLGNGDGTFKLPVPESLSSGFATSIVIADFNGDTKMDIAAGLSVGKATLLLGNGDGTFQPAKDVLSSGNRCVALAVGDLNGDSKLDLAVRSELFSLGQLSNFDSILVELGNGDGTFPSSPSFQTTTRAFAGCDLALADFNEDGKLDIAFERSGNAIFLLGAGDGSFVGAPALFSLPAGSGSGFVAIGDFNGDKQPDLAVTSSGDNTVAVLLNTSPTSGADLAIPSLTGSPEPVRVGINLTYSMDVANTGPQDATNVTLTDTLPAGVTFVSATASQGTCTGTSVVTCDLGSLPSPSLVTVTVVVTPNQAGSIINTASVTATEPDLAPSNNTASFTSTVVLPADLAVTETAPVSSIAVGSNITYTLNVTNNGPASATNVILSYSPSSSSTVVSVAQSQGSSCPTGPADGSTTFFCNLGTLAAGATATATLVVTPNAIGALTNTASIGADQPDQNTNNNSASVTVNVTPAPDFTLTPASTTFTAQKGAQVTDALTLTGQNGFSGPVTLSCAVTGSAPMATCKVSPSPVTLGSSPGTATLTITAPATLAALALPLSKGSRPLYAAVLPLPALLLGAIRLVSRKFRNRRRGLWLLGGSVIVLFAVLAGCGGGSTTPPPQNFAVTVTAKSGSLQHSTTVTLTVQ